MRKIAFVFISVVVMSAAFFTLNGSAQMGSDVMGPGSGTGWGVGAFRSNGERIYYTSTSNRGTEIAYTGGPSYGGWMMMRGRLACVSCHGPDGRGGIHRMGMMQVMDAKDIRWSVLKKEFDAKKFQMAVVKGQDPDGTQLKPDMPRWNISNEDLADLIAFLKKLP
ncbi:MAG: cytochrome C oxidase subunit II [Deltaproteobacteria bacterium HGW-Deltaproteobacteria-19]|jgi:cytochrome c553|nr:MAG: cytochrome C oxidase subunit II [Deltaproteobacteria bacterium HGW-Deltaproteobacteria-19]